ncbi:type II secretion system F family protein [Candidatus Blastococcus massiliensis]|uniref:type II secretion system F family protein n=1 Tax=Candidatus Blastococcus massiliensis TaxID=1470358 RepID=UPI0004AD48BC|nr:type II secretion system F family protein [Candidatus Blastococcus massiliensis]
MTAHGLGATLGVLAAALVLWPAAGGTGARRWAALRRAEDGVRPPAPERTGPGERRRRWVLAGAAGLAVALVLGGPVGLAAGGVVAVVAERALGRGLPDEAATTRTALHRDLPAACDLLAVCLTAGLPVDGALEAVGGAVQGPLGDHLRSVAALSRLGADPRRAWADAPEPLAPLGRVFERAGESGATVVGALRTLAGESRAAERAATQAAVHRAGVWVLAPLGLCFLPAFLCLGVVPLVLGIAGDVFG